MPTAESLTNDLRDALDHLYDPGRLRSNPLAVLLNVAGKPDTPFALRQVLTDVVGALKPGPEVPTKAPTWRAYEILYSRYVQQFSQKEVAEQLGLSVRQLRREQEAALGLLAERLYADYALGAKNPEAGTPRNEQLARKVVSFTSDQELAWMKEASPNESANVAQII